ncbi:plasmid mobilization relaxosome protein MobC [Phenylobacterium sp. LjRoot225]|uniref:plasmid mobilization relaxosome protein MobC n=1 Tax=Phenylobacterium sp. LjRoot225 TaxID=3342285 RepID=UPI003ECCC25C
MAMFAFQLPDALAARFDAMAVQGRSKKLRELVAGAVGDATAVPATGLRRKSVKLTLRLKPEDMTALDAAARKEGMLRTDWMLALMRRRLFGRPKFGRKEELAFYAVQEELRRIGVNLNQIARAMNTAVMPGTVLTSEIRQVEDFRGELRAHVRGLKDAFQGNLDFWEVEE